MRMVRAIIGVGIVLAAVSVSAQPMVVNSSFEEDAYSVWPGYAGQNGAKIRGWEYNGAAGLSPVWEYPEDQTGPQPGFIDNGRIPDGKQVAFMQNPGTLAQEVRGFEPGKRYVVVYEESARQTRSGPEDPRLLVTVDDTVVVPEHVVLPADKQNQFEGAYHRIVSQPFEAPADGSAVVAFRSTVGNGVSLLLDAVGIEEAGPEVAATFLTVQNAGFEEDEYTNPPGYTSGNGAEIAGWDHEGNTGINPIWNAQGAVMPFADNGTIPEGNQVAFIQNVGTLWQSVPGFRKGHGYQVTYRENARAFHPDADSASLPVLELVVNGETIVSPHEVPAVESQKGHVAPYAFVESAVFVAPSDGTFDLAFRTSEGNAVTVLIDAVQVRAVRIEK